MPPRTPPCSKCPKPELEESSREAWLLWTYVQNQCDWGPMSGERLSVRMTDAVAALNELERQGLITNRARAFKRLWIIEGVARAASSRKAQEEARRAGTPAS